MYVDRSLAAGWSARTARDHGVDVLLDAWSGAPPDRRAAMVVAQGDLARAASYAGGPWKQLLEGDLKAALEGARKAAGAPGMALLESEALFVAGGVVAGLERLEALHRQGNAAGTVALVRRRHQLGDHLGALRTAQALPWHAHVALAGARAALVAKRPGSALRFVEPYLQGFAPVPEPAVAGALAMTTAAILARLGEHGQLQRFADRLLAAGDLADDMKPAVARTAWTAGRAGEAWRRFDPEQGPWCVAARLELATLAGDAELAGKLLARAGPLGVAAAPAVDLLRGSGDASAVDGDGLLTDSARQVFAEGRTVHVWRTHPFRWQPWIDAAARTAADVVICDLAAEQLPAADVLPEAVLDDGALVDLVSPVRTSPVAGGTGGVTFGEELCRGVGVGHDWPDIETAAARQALPAGGEGPPVRVASGDEALAQASSGRPLVVIAPPGDPFWAGPLPERVWRSMRVVRSNAQQGWDGAGARVADAVIALLDQAAGAARLRTDGFG